MSTANIYSNGKIYKISHSDLSDPRDIYVGSTTIDINIRFSQHKSTTNKYLREIFDKYGFKTCKVELIEDYPCETKLDLTTRENYWIKRLKAKFNIYSAGAGDCGGGFGWSFRVCFL